ncbi:MAG: type I methionyl aminopeptidase [Planctomycetota bacterium]|nr:MAG: type I methionyl aminopeptidase [Planctomycetota bacterium]
MENRITIKKLGRNDPCWCDSGKKYKKCHMTQDMSIKRPQSSFNLPVASKHLISKGQISPLRAVPAHIKRPNYAENGGDETESSMQNKLSSQEIEQMRLTCRAARRVLDKAIKAVRPGITTDYLDAVVHEACIAEGGYPSPLNYNGFPKSVCTSVNEVICHGIPDDRPLENGDIVNIDVTIFLNGLHGDCSETVPVGNIEPESQNLLAVVYESMMRGIAAIKPDGLLRDIGRAIETYVKKHGYSVVRAYCGHGIGRHFHCSPTIPHFYNPEEYTKIKPGMVFTVEPMVNMGTWKHTIWKDGWTAVTLDLKRSAQFEHTVLVAQDGVDILTLSEKQSQLFLGQNNKNHTRQEDYASSIDMV